MPRPIEWLRDNASCCTAHHDRVFARNIRLILRTRPISGPQSKGMAEAFVCTRKRNYVRVNPKPDVRNVIEQLPGWFAHYNKVRPHRALCYRFSRKFITQNRKTPSGL